MHETQLVLTTHAYRRYQERVGPIRRGQLISQLRHQLRKPDRRKRSYIQLGGVWWRCSVKDGVTIFHTCYGRHVGNLPEAIRWAKRHGDRIALGGRDG